MRRRVGRETPETWVIVDANEAWQVSTSWWNRSDRIAGRRAHRAAAAGRQGWYAYFTVCADENRESLSDLASLKDYAVADIKRDKSDDYRETLDMQRSRGAMASEGRASGLAPASCWPGRRNGAISMVLFSQCGTGKGCRCRAMG